MKASKEKVASEVVKADKKKVATELEIIRRLFEVLALVGPVDAFNEYNVDELLSGDGCGVETKDAPFNFAHVMSTLNALQDVCAWVTEDEEFRAYLLLERACCFVAHERTEFQGRDSEALQKIFGELMLRPLYKIESEKGRREHYSSYTLPRLLKAIDLAFELGFYLVPNNKTIEVIADVEEGKDLVEAESIDDILADTTKKDDKKE